MLIDKLHRKTKKKRSTLTLKQIFSPMETLPQAIQDLNARFHAFKFETMSPEEEDKVYTTYAELLRAAIRFVTEYGLHVSADQFHNVFVILANAHKLYHKFLYLTDPSTFSEKELRKIASRSKIIRLIDRELSSSLRRAALLNPTVPTQFGPNDKFFSYLVSENQVKVELDTADLFTRIAKQPTAASLEKSIKSALA